MPTRIAINGFGRIGRQAFKIAGGHPGLEVVAINDLASPENLAYLLAHDSVYGKYERQIQAEDNALIVDGNRIPVFSIVSPWELPWKELQIDIVIEATGKFKTAEQARAHIEAGARAVVVSAPAKGAPTFVRGVNDQILEDDSLSVVSNASCTTNSIAPVMDVLDRRFGVQKAF